MESFLVTGALVALFYLWHTFGVTIGLHRLLSHRAFRCHKAFEYFMVLGAYLAFHGSPCWWATIHRAHHRHVETPLDPHTPNMGMLHAYTFYRDFRYPAHIDPVKQSPDILKDPVYRLLECGADWRVGYGLNVAICILFRVGLFFLFGWQVCLASVIAGILALNVPLLLNIFCHISRCGYKNFSIADDSVNSWFFAVIALGDGWHNNHHAYPASSRMGVLNHEFDASWFLLKVMQRIGLVYSINESMPLGLPREATAVAVSRVVEKVTHR